MHKKNRIQTPLKRVGRLKQPQDIAKYIAKSIRRVERGGEDGDVTTNYKKVMMSIMLLKAIEVSTIEKRLIRLEELIEGKKNP